jgi:signal transduction histidine kinase
VAVEVQGDAPADADRDREVLRIAQEALHNALRHAAPAALTVELRAQPSGGLTLSVRDDGAGFDPADPDLRTRHLGLTSMEERAARLGGRLSVRSAPGEGTVVTLEVPGG